MTGHHFSTTRRIRFSECDPAGIAFYPRLIEGVNNTVEDWFEEAIGFSFGEMHLNSHHGVPTRSISLEFETPAKLGDLITWSLQVRSLGKSSIKLLVEASHADGRLVLHAKPALVWCDYRGETPKSAEVPNEIRAKMMLYVRQMEPEIDENL